MTDHNEITAHALEVALGHGCQDMKAVLMENCEDTIHLRDGELERMHHALARSLVLHLLIDGRCGYFYTQRLERAELDAFIRQAVDITRMLEPDPSFTLSDPARYYRGGGPRLNIFDHSLSHIPPHEKLLLARHTDAQLTGSHPSLLSVQTRYSDRQFRAWYRISNGFEGYEERSRVTLTSMCAVEGKDGQRPMDGWGESRIFLADMPRQGIAQTALRRTLQKVGQRPAPSGQYTMILESPVAGHMLGPLLSAMTGQALHQRTSFLLDKQDALVGSPLLDVVDDPLIPGTRGACHFDEDGVATCRRQIFAQGRLHTYFIDTPSSRKLALPPTTCGTHHLVFTPGPHTLEGLMQLAGRAILVTDFNGGNCDPSTGRFSYGIEGFLVEGGQIVQPVSGMNVTGDMLSLWQSLAAVAHDADPWEAELIPSLLFSDVTFGGI